MNNLPPPVAYRRFLNMFRCLEASIRPVELHEIGDISYLHWPGEGRRGWRFFYEFFGVDCDPVDMFAAVGAVNPKQPFFISDFHSERGPAVEGYRSLGYESSVREPVMVLDLASPRSDSPDIQVDDVCNIALAHQIYVELDPHDAMPRTTSQQQVDDPNTLIKVIMVDGIPVCTGKGILLDGSLYLTDIGTLPAYRKRGLAGAIMQALHTSAWERGATNAILSATEIAAPLYKSLGYRQIGILDIYEPRKPPDVD